MHIVIWMLAALALGLWSLLAWGTASLLGMDPSWAVNPGPLLDQVPYSAIIEAWVPGWRALLLAAFEMTRTLIGWMGGFGQVLLWVLWGVWAVGALVVVVGAALLSGLVVLIRRNTAPPRPGAGAVI